eukprot:jgi/Botrbrau1/12604/Bobra.0169s0132.2
MLCLCFGAVRTQARVLGGPAEVLPNGKEEWERRPKPSDAASSVSASTDTGNPWNWPWTWPASSPLSGESIPAPAPGPILIPMRKPAYAPLYQPHSEPSSPLYAPVYQTPNPTLPGPSHSHKPGWPHMAWNQSQHPPSASWSPSPTVEPASPPPMSSPMLEASPLPPPPPPSPPSPAPTSPVNEDIDAAPNNDVEDATDVDAYAAFPPSLIAPAHAPAPGPDDGSETWDDEPAEAAAPAPSEDIDFQGDGPNGILEESGNQEQDDEALKTEERDTQTSTFTATVTAATAGAD